MNKILFYFTIGLIVCSSCKEVDPPMPPQPEITTVRDIGRNSAVLSGSILSTGNNYIRSCNFLYGLTPDMETCLYVTPDAEQRVEIQLNELKAGCEYYFCLEVSNHNSCVRSEMHSFRTMPNAVPILGEIRPVNQGPLSATIECTISDDGGEAFTRIGFLYKEISATKEQFIPADEQQADSFSARITDLNQNTSYSIRACIANSIGEVYSTPITIATDNAILITVPGTLPEIVGNEWKYRMNKITIAGNINGTDIRFLREMAGCDANGRETKGQLTEINLTDCQIVEGGSSYYQSHYTASERLGSEMFAYCTKLEKIRLPQSLVSIEEKAFQECHLLTELYIPEKVINIGFSSGCTQLVKYIVSPFNKAFISINGAVYSKNETIFMLYPRAKETEGFALPSTVTQIGNYAFCETKFTELALPISVTTLGNYAFSCSHLTSIILPAAISTVSKGAFQQCDALTFVTLGEGVSFISSYSFSNCPALTRLQLLPFIPPICREDAFTENELFSQCVLQVPLGCKKTYQTSPQWGRFARIVESGN